MTTRSLLKRFPWLESLARHAIATVPFRMRQRSEFWSFFHTLQASEDLPWDVVQEAQLETIIEMVRLARTRSPFYGRLYAEHGVSETDIGSFDDFASKIPVVTRSMLTAGETISVGHKGTTQASTSGTSGTPFVFPIDHAARAMDRAAIFYLWSKVGFRPGTPRLELRGFQTEPIEEFPHHAVTRFSVVNMEQHLVDMVTYLNRKRLRFIHGYPSAIAKFAMLVRDRGLGLDYPIRAVLLASEPVYQWQVEVIEAALQPGDVHAFYGSAERTTLAGLCEKGAYHFLPQFGYPEVGPDREIIGTGFLNRATPFIRYRSTDAVREWSTDSPHTCRYDHMKPVVGAIEGRLEDYLTDADGELIPPATVTFPFKKLDCITGVQLHQDSEGRLTIRYTSRPGDPGGLRRDMSETTRALRRLVGDVPIEFEPVDALPTTSAGKFKWIVSESVGGSVS